jgi:hypothetical protein
VSGLRVGGVLTLAAFLLFGCSLLLGENLSGVEVPKEALVASHADGAPASSADSSSTVDTGSADARADAPPSPSSLLVNGDFDLGCASWVAEDGTSTDETVLQRAGTGACRFCGPVVANFVQVVNRAIVPGETFLFEIWVRSAPGQPSSTFRIETFSLFPGNIESYSQSSVYPLTETWTRASVLFRAKVAASNVFVKVVPVPVDAGAQSCVIADDARLTPQ